MLLRTRLAIALGLSSLLAGSITVFAVREVRSMSLAADAAARGQDALANARGLLSHTYEFALYGVPRAAQQWRQRHQALIVDLGELSGAAAPGLDGHVRSELGELPALFLLLERARAADPGDATAVPRAELLTASLIGSTQSILDETREALMELAAERERSERRLAAVAVAALLLVISMLGMTGLGLLSGVLRPMRRLQVVMAEVTGGNLSARSALTRQDEIGELSRAFDSMTAALQRVLAERAASERQLRLIADNLPVRVARFDAQGRFLFANQAACLAYGAASEADLRGRALEQVCPPAAYLALRPHAEAVLKGQPQVFVVEETLDAGSMPSFIAVSFVPDQAADGPVQGWYAMVQDITESTLNRRRIEQSLAEKDVLLREIHHRVKNNLQVVNSLLSLQAKQSTDAAVRVQLEESCDRIRSMALIHEKLYRTESLSAIDFGEYLRGLVGMIAASHGLRGVDVALEVEPLTLDIDRAVPAALAVNELVSNSFKHAFPGGRSGRVTVAFGRLGSHRLRLQVHDDGVGAAGLDPLRAPSLGLRLIRLLSAQLEAHLSTTTTPGFKTVLEFPALRPSEGGGTDD